ncbi:MAG: hypothetical protein N3C59_03765 [Azovibrio sp.]|nr:hypothetical protein [Azovibrio sp.]
MQRLLFGLCAALPMFAAHAGDLAPLRDPTRPPGLAQQAAGSAEQGLRLDAIKRGRAGKALAVINGTRLYVGDEIQGWRLMAVGDSAVRLQGPEGRQTLRLTPAVEATRPGQAGSGGKSK